MPIASYKSWEKTHTTSRPETLVAEDYEFIRGRFLTEGKEQAAQSLADKLKRAAQSVKKSAREEMEVAKQFTAADWINIFAPAIVEFGGGVARGLLTGLLKAASSAISSSIGRGGGSGGGGGGSSW